MVWEADENPSAVSLASVSPKHEYDQSVITMAEVPALSPWPALPPESALSAGCPLTVLLAVSATVAPPKADSPLKRPAVLQA